MNPAGSGPGTGSPALRLRRRYPASCDDLFDAFTNPDRLCQWWGPKGGHIHEIVFPAREGARYLVRLTGPDGTRFAHEGRFLEVDPPRRLVYTWTWTEGPLDRAETLVEVSFTPDGDGAIVEVCHSRFVDDAERDRHTGWDDSLEALDDWVRRRKPAVPDS